MQRQELYILGRLDDLEGRSRRNNVIFDGLKYSNGDDYRKVVKEFCVNALKCPENMWVNRAHPIGQDGQLIAHFPVDEDVQWIMRNTKKLKGTGYYINRDFTREVRKKRGRLHKVRKELERLGGKRKMPLVHDHLIVENCKFFWSEGKLMAGKEDGCVKLKEMLDLDIADFVRMLEADAGPERRLHGEERPQPHH